MNYSRDDSRSVSPAMPYVHTLRSMVAYAPRLLALLVLAIYFPAIVAAGLLIALTSSGPVVVKKAYRRGDGSEDVVYLYETAYRMLADVAADFTGQISLQQ